MRPLKKLKQGDKVWWIHFSSSGERSFIRAEIFQVRESYTYTMKPIKVYFDEWFSAEDSIPTLGVQVPRYQLFTDKELNHFQDKYSLIESLFYYRD